MAKERYNLTGIYRRSYSVVRCSSRDDIFPFLSAQPAGVGWKIGDQEVRTNADEDGRYTFEYEDPSPAAVAADTFHGANGTGK